jgi:pimeloyl-ACP methyl ester carboxylesterase
MPQISIDTNGNMLYYAEYGSKSGYPILINHGLIASIKDYAIFERLIASGARLICMARPGYGDSSACLLNHIGEWADIVSILIETLNLSQFDCLGMSSGAPYSYALGYKFPDKVRNIYIFSGIPALYDEKVASFWPHKLNKNASMAEMEALAHELFFSNLSKEDLTKNEIQDSMRNNSFGIAQDFRLRGIDWGFKVSDLKGNVTMQHSKYDTAVPFITAEITSKLIQNCRFEIKENDVHYSGEALDDFIKNFIAPHYEK